MPCRDNPQAFGKAGLEFKLSQQNWLEKNRIQFSERTKYYLFAGIIS